MTYVRPGPLKIWYGYTGGTAGSKKGPNGLEPGMSAKAMLYEMERAYPGFQDGLEITAVDLDQKDSTDIDFRDRLRYVQSIELARKRGFCDVAIIQHGTNKLENTSSHIALHYPFKDFAVISTGASSGLEDPNNNVLSNLHGAFETARLTWKDDQGRERRLVGDHVFFDDRVMWAIRARKAPTAYTKLYDLDFYKSTSEKNFTFQSRGDYITGGRIAGGKIAFTEAGLEVQRRYSKKADALRKKLRDTSLIVEYPERVLDWARMWENYDNSHPIDLEYDSSAHWGIVIETWGSGDLEETLLPIIKKRTQEGKLTAVASMIPEIDTDITGYKVGSRGINNGGLPLYDMPSPVALMKMRMLMGMTYENKAEIQPNVDIVRRLMYYPLADAINPNFEELEQFPQTKGMYMSDDEFYEKVVMHYILRRKMELTQGDSEEARMNRTNNKRGAAEMWLRHAAEVVGAKSDIDPRELERIIAMSQKISGYGEPQAYSSAKKRGSVLIVEDSKDFAEGLYATLLSRNFNAYIANDAASALEMLKEMSVDMVLADVGLPDMDGRDMVKQIQRKYKQTLCFGMTGMEEAVVGKKDNLTLFKKPFGSKDLDRMIKEYETRRAEKNRKPTILLVDDDKDSREFMEFVLSKNGAEVISAADAKSGIDLYRKGSPDVVLADVMLPDVNGIEMVGKIREQNPEKSIPVYFFTSSESKFTELKSRGERVFKKPQDTVELPGIIIEDYKSSLER